MEVNKVNSLKIDRQMGKGRTAASSNGNKVAFGGISSVPLNTMDFIARGGLCASFCIQDGLGMIVPRIAQGFYRNKDVTGEYNFAEAQEVAIREILTGPPMFLFPIAILAASKKYVGKACNVSFDFLKAFGNTMKNAVDEKKIKSADFERSFYNQAVSNILYNSTDKNLSGKELDAETKYFVDSLFDIEKSKPKTLSQKMMNKAVPTSADDKLAALKNRFIDLRKKYSTSPSEIYSNVTLNVNNQKYNSSFDTFVSYLKDFTQDAEKFTKKNGLTKESIEKFTAKRSTFRKGMIGAMFLCVMGFCNKIPDWYKRHEVNPGLNGLNVNKGETFASASQSIKKDASNTDSKKNVMKSPFGSQDNQKFWLQKEVKA